MRVKFELGEEKAIVMMVRPLILSDIWEYVLKRFGNRYNLYYYSNEVRYWCITHVVMCLSCDDSCDGHVTVM